MADAAPAGDNTYDEDGEKLGAFLQDYTEEDEVGNPLRKYMKVLEQVANREVRRVDIELDDVAEHMGEEMAEKVRRNTLRYKEIIACAIDNVLPAPTAAAADRDVFDVLMEERTRAAAAAASDAVGGVDPNNKVPAELTRRYQVFVLPRVKDKSVPLRQVKAKHIGSLLTLKGIVTRVTEVKPQMKVATYTCEQDGTEVYQLVHGTTFMPQTNWNGMTLHLQAHEPPLGPAPPPKP